MINMRRADSITPMRELSVSGQMIRGHPVAYVTLFALLRSASLIKQNPWVFFLRIQFGVDEISVSRDLSYRKQYLSLLRCVRYLEILSCISVFLIDLLGA